MLGWLRSSLAQDGADASEEESEDSVVHSVADPGEASPSSEEDTGRIPKRSKAARNFKPRSQEEYSNICINNNDYCTY